MLQPLFESSTIPLLEKVAAFGERRQEVLAGNIANIDTPHYKTRDLPVEAFQQALRDAVARRYSPGASAGKPSAGVAHTRFAPELFPDHLFQAVQSPARNITFQDAGNRSAEQEVMEMAKNAMMQSYAVELLHAQMSLLQSVIREQA